MKPKLVKLLLLITVFLLISGVAIYIYLLYNRRPPDLRAETPRYFLQAEELMKEFSANENAATSRYINQLLLVEGILSKVEKDETGFPTLVMEAGPSFTIRCSMDSAQSKEMRAAPITGQRIKVKGICTGYLNNELLGADVILNRCVIDKENNNEQ